MRFDIGFILSHMKPSRKPGTIQIERELGETFRPLGTSVSTLYGSAGIEVEDNEALRTSEIVVATPEKLDFALRNDDSIIDSVGLIVLDEGHMLGPNEREVRYEALVQRLLQRPDAAERRIVCLSALFPTPDEMKNLTAWLRQDAPGEPIHSQWRPTRQRFGVLQWTGNAARLDVKVEQESPYVPRFVEEVDPPQGSRRRKAFPADKNELTLATAWRFVGQDKEVMIYCVIRASVETLGRQILKCIKQGVLPPLRPLNDRIRNAMATGAEWLGDEHPAVQCLQYGVALHHGGLPRQFLTEVERLMRTKDCPLVIASPTLAQGLNLSASVLLVPSIWRNKEVIPAAEFANVAGRAGRAFVDVEGLVIHVVWENPTYSISQWNKLVREARAPLIQSGILALTINLYRRIAKMAGVSLDDALEYVTGQDAAWDFAQQPELGFSEAEWDRDLASLDSAVLALLDAETEAESLDEAITGVLDKSLFARELEKYKTEVRRLIRGFIAIRSQNIWKHTTVAQRRGYHAAGIGFVAGKFLDAHVDDLVVHLLVLEAAVLTNDSTIAADAAVSFAGLILKIAPFTPPKGLPLTWADALSAWMEGRASSDVLEICGEDGSDFVQEAFAYRLPWAMEAVRVHGLAVGASGADELTGSAALAIEAGCVNRSVILLLRTGLNSREGAMAAVELTGATFENRDEMREWMKSEEVQEGTRTSDWPTASSRHAWLQFLRDDGTEDRREWGWHRQKLKVKWSDEIPRRGAAVVVEPIAGGSVAVTSPELSRLGVLAEPMPRPRKQFVCGTVISASEVELEFFGPAPLN